MSFLKVVEVHKSYADEPLLRGVSFAMEQGEITCLLGPSGSGKTTLLRILAGLEASEKGQLWLEGQNLAGVPAHQRGIVMMFQEYALFPHRSIAENIAFGLRMRKESKSTVDKQVAEMLELVGLEGFGSRNVIELSGGEQQRVALARSLAPHPRLLLLDEPLGALDRNLRERLLDDLPAILKHVGVTAISVTHDQEEAFAIADRVVLLHEGSVIQTGTPQDVFDTPASAWVARFLGLDNLFEAVLSAPEQIQTTFGTLKLPTNAAASAGPAKGTLLIHPWGLHLESQGQHSHNTFTAQVVKRTFHGRAYAITLEVEGQRLRLTRHAGKPIPAVGESIRLWIDPQALRWLKRDPAA